MADKQGTGQWELLGNLYSWTALRELTIRDFSDNAGTYAEMTLSNMRKRITGTRGQGAGSTEVFQDRTYDTRLKLDPGTHMYVYVGYGPDPSHMKSVAGRITNVRHGPATRVQVSSYGTTLNQPPNQGRGFYVDGWDGKQTLAEAVLYTIAQTGGLEGLGRRAVGAGTDSLGRVDETQDENDYRTSLATSIYRAFGSPDFGLIDEESAEDSIRNLISIVDERGVQEMKELLLGHPQVFENVWLASSNDLAGASDAFFGGVKDMLTSGKGWGWAARPGQTAWATLKDQSKLFPDYIVTTRQYNENVPIGQMADDPLRETLYFGPRTGSYIHSSKDPSGSATFVRLSEENLDGLASEVVKREREARPRSKAAKETSGRASVITEEGRRALYKIPTALLPTAYALPHLFRPVSGFRPILPQSLLTQSLLLKRDPGSGSGCS